MSVTFTHAGSLHTRLWESVTFDSSMAFALMRPGIVGRYFGECVSDLLSAAGRMQPTVSPAMREVKRVDLGNVQVGLARSGRDVTVLGAERLSASDAQLLHVMTSRAGVNLYLVTEGEASAQLGHWAQKTAHLVTGEELYVQWQRRQGANGRRDSWECQRALTPGVKDNQTCAEHKTLTACVLAWFPHALATARASPRQVRSRLYELASNNAPESWDIYAHARDSYYLALKAAEAADLPESIVSSAKIRDLSRDGTKLAASRGHTYQIPAGPSVVLAARRDVKTADGFAPESTLFQVRETTVKRFLLPRPGDPK
jgi:hypothetical protein